MDWSILKGKCSSDIYDYKVCQLRNNSQTFYKTIDDNILNMQFNDNKIINNNESISIIFYNDNSFMTYENYNEICNATTKILFGTFEIINYGGYIFILKKYSKDIKLKDVLLDLHYLYNFFHDDILREELSLCGRTFYSLNLNKDNKFRGFQPFHSINDDLYFVFNYGF